MGCGGSKDEYADATSGGGAAPTSASSGKAELFSEESHAMLSVKVQGGKTSYDQYVSEEKTGSSNNIAKAWGLSKGNSLDMRYWKDNEFPAISTVTTKPYGDITLGDSDSLSLLLATHLPGVPLVATRTHMHTRSRTRIHMLTSVCHWAR